MSPNTMRLLSVAAALVAGLTGCSSEEPAPEASPSAYAPSTDPAALSGALSRFGGFPCTLLNDQDLADLGIVETLELDYAEGLASSCHWISATNTQLGFIPYPEDDASDNWMASPESQPVKIAGAFGTEYADEDTCYVIVNVDEDNEFAVLADRLEPDAPDDMCGLAAEFAELIFAKLEQVAGAEEE